MQYFSVFIFYSKSEKTWRHCGNNLTPSPHKDWRGYWAVGSRGGVEVFLRVALLVKFFNISLQLFLVKGKTFFFASTPPRIHEARMVTSFPRKIGVYLVPQCLHTCSTFFYGQVVINFIV